MAMHNDFVVVDVIGSSAKLPCFLDANRSPLLLFHLLDQRFDFAIIAVVDAVNVLSDNGIHTTFVECSS